jgi:hypothetical protein
MALLEVVFEYVEQGESGGVSGKVCVCGFGRRLNELGDGER